LAVLGLVNRFYRDFDIICDQGLHWESNL
jgi:hypothetical protein